MSDMSDISNIISKFVEAKQKLAEWEKRHEKYRMLIEDHMRQNDLTTIDQTVDETPYHLKKIMMNRETLCKKDVPNDIWEKYSKSTRYVMLRLDKKNPKTK